MFVHRLLTGNGALPGRRQRKRGTPRRWRREGAVVLGTVREIGWRQLAPVVVRERVAGVPGQRAGSQSPAWTGCAGVSSGRPRCLRIFRATGPRSIFAIIRPVDPQEQARTFIWNTRRQQRSPADPPRPSPAGPQRRFLVALLTKFVGFHGIVMNLNVAQKLVVAHLKGTGGYDGIWGRPAPGVAVDRWAPPIKNLRKRT